MNFRQTRTVSSEYRRGHQDHDAALLPPPPICGNGFSLPSFPLASSREIFWFGWLLWFFSLFRAWLWPKVTAASSSPTRFLLLRGHLLFSTGVGDISRGGWAFLVLTSSFLTVELVANGIAAPVVEEMNFHGYMHAQDLQPGAKAPVVNTVLFSFYHLFQPLSVHKPHHPVLCRRGLQAWWKTHIYVSMSLPRPWQPRWLSTRHCC